MKRKVLIIISAMFILLLVSKKINAINEGGMIIYESVYSNYQEWSGDIFTLYGGERSKLSDETIFKIKTNQDSTYRTFNNKFYISAYGEDGWQSSTVTVEAKEGYMIFIYEGNNSDKIKWQGTAIQFDGGYPDDVRDDTIFKMSFGKTGRFSPINELLNMQDWQSTLITIEARLIEKPNKKPVINGEAMIINNVSKPFSQNEIKKIAAIMAYDENDGDITNKITLIKDDYIKNSNKIGVYEQEYKVINSKGIAAFFTLKISNHDLEAPKIIGIDKSTISYKETDALDKIKMLYTVADNIDKDIELIISSNNYAKNKVGKYEVIVTAIDSSGNKSNVIHELNVIDDIAPTISDVNNKMIKINNDKVINNKLLLEGLTAIDEVDGNITKEIKIIHNGIIFKSGKYEVVYEVSDLSGNKATHTRIYEYELITVPKFYINEKLISIEKVSSISIDQLVKIITEYEKINFLEYQVIEDEYSSNYNSVGSYNLSVKIKDKEGVDHYIKKTIKVFDELEPEDRKVFSINNLIWLLIGIIVIIGILSFIYKKVIKEKFNMQK